MYFVVFVFDYSLIKDSCALSDLNELLVQLLFSGLVGFDCDLNFNLFLWLGTRHPESIGLVFKQLIVRESSSSNLSVFL